MTAELSQAFRTKREGVGFVLDALTLYRQVPPDDTRQFAIGAVKAVAKYLGSAVVFLWVGLGAYRLGREVRDSTERRRTDAPLIVGTS